MTDPREAATTAEHGPAHLGHHLACTLLATGLSQPKRPKLAGIGC